MVKLALRRRASLTRWRYPSVHLFALMAVAQPMPSFTYALVRFSSSEDSRLHKPVEATVIRYCAWDSWPTQIPVILHGPLLPNYSTA